MTERGRGWTTPRLIAALSLAFLGLAAASRGAAAQESAQVSPSSGKSAARVETDVLIDARRAFDFSDVPFSPLDVDYHRLYSFNRAFDYLRSRGVRVERFDGPDPLDDETLARCKVLFFNLPSADREPFLVSEILAIKRFIEDGGAAFFIVDHSNCYFHANRLKPLWRELEMVPQTVTVCDATRRLGVGFGWVYFDDFSEHPVTQGLRQIAFQTGGAVDSRWAVAWSSENSWADEAIIPIYGEASLAYFGDFTRGRGEFVGRQGVALAKDFGRGKIVAVGDQNIFSNFFLNYLDNYRLWLNAFAWTLDRPELADAAAYRAETAKKTTVLCWEELKRDDSRRFGNPDDGGYYNLYAYLNRFYNVVAVANNDPDDDWDADVALLIGGDETFSDGALAFATRALQTGKTLAILDPKPNALDDEKSLVFKVCEKVSGFGDAFCSPKTTTDATAARLEYRSGARLTLIAGAARSFDNSSVPPPETAPTQAQKTNLAPLLAEIARAAKTRADAQNRPNEETNDE